MWCKINDDLYNLDRFKQIYIMSRSILVLFDGEENENIEFDSEIDAEIEFERIQNILGI